MTSFGGAEMSIYDRLKTVTRKYIIGDGDVVPVFTKIYFAILVKLLSPFVHVKSGRWIFGSEMGYDYSSNSKYLFEFIQNKRPDLTPIWISKRKSIVDLVNNSGGKAYSNYSYQGVLQILSADVYCCSTDPADVLFIRVDTCLIINLWHSVTIKKVVYDKWPDGAKKKKSFKNRFIGRPMFMDVDLHICSSESQKKVLSSAFNSTNFSICGQPREDIIFENRKVIASRVKSHLGIQNKILILYMPTHRKYGAGNATPTLFRDHPHGRASLKDLNAVACTKNHINMKQKVDDYCDPEGVIQEITLCGIDTQELLIAADLLITDYSSCYIEYLHLDRPILFFHYDNFKEEDHGLYFSEEEIMPGPILQSEDALLAEIIKSLREPSLFSGERRRVCEFFYKFPNGKACQRTVQAILSLTKSSKIE